MSHTPVRGLFLDLDGTLALSDDLVHGVYQDFLRAHGRRGGQSEYESLLARPIRQWIVVLKQRHALIPTEAALRQEFAGLLEQRYPGHSRLAPGAEELLTEARTRGIFTVVVTSAASILVEDFLRRHSLTDLVRTVVAADDVVLGKPDPEPYLKALGLAGLQPAQVLAVEDSPNGAKSALAAGLATYLIVNDDEARLPSLPGLAGIIRGLPQLMPLLDASGTRSDL